MAYTFAVDTDNMKTLADELKTAKESISSGSTGIPGIFSTIDGMDGNCWSGSSYDTFKEGAHKYEKALNTLPDVIAAFENELNKMNGLAPDLIKEVGNQITNMTND